IVPKVANVTDVMATLESKDMSSNLFLAETHKKVMTVLRMADALSTRYAVVVANPPYMGGKGMNPRLSTWAKENFPSSKYDLFAMFIERGFDLTPKFG
ncbi:restriction endonuclease, partial [Pseudomonas aeruginosa]|nr:restriction endonuclease [Pseudomonas aeruginosa]